jgi:ELWxxDGT repeat protein
VWQASAFRLRSSSVQYLTEVRGRLCFDGGDDTHGYELWRSDGTEAGTVPVTDIQYDDGWYPWHLTGVNDMLFFTGDDGIHGGELWALPVGPAHSIYLPSVLRN